MNECAQISLNYTQKNIDEIIRYATEKVVSELKKARLIRKEGRTSFTKTEQLLYNYRNFQESIDDKLEQIEMIRLVGIKKKSKDITSCMSRSGYYEAATDLEKGEEQIRKLEISIEETTEYIERIDRAVSKLKDDPYYELIRLKYFEEKTREEIAEILNVDVSTISRNKNRLINMLKITLFSDDAAREMLGEA